MVWVVKQKDGALYHNPFFKQGVPVDQASRFILKPTAEYVAACIQGKVEEVAR